ncbi:preprotein translocase subunit SecA [Candidatus Saccharibacteria bacterium]|nr:preprotein translocase subunit SecA [Candidatus Saccharibacteria bacterium]MCL1962806.1 preprotein translocase subunit SecA [Candidatus Saccharibacteria bacterium]
MSKKDKLLGKVFGDPQKKILKRLRKQVDGINALGDKYAKMSDAELAKQTDVLKKKYAKLSKQVETDDKKPAKNTAKPSKTKADKNAPEIINKLSDEERAKYAKAGAGSIDDFNALEAIRARRAVQKQKSALDEILPEAFAVVREMATRVLKQRHFDVQMMGGITLHEGNIAEMKTGEGKTLVVTAPVYLNALIGKGVHVVTVNDYLAQLHGCWMGSLYHALGLTTGVIINDASFVYDSEYVNENHFDKRMQQLRPASRKEAYAADITYGTNNEFGFDYLRDNMVSDPELLRQHELYFAIVDEADSILIDEARTPLIISAPAAENPDMYIKFAAIAATLEAPKKDPNAPKSMKNPLTHKSINPEDDEEDGDYTLDEKRRSVTLTDQGVEKVEKLLGLKNLYSPDHVRAVYHMDQALKAQTLFKRDKDYVVTNDGEVIIVDEFTGRLMHGRRYNEGLHQAIEAKEHVTVREESQTLATISFQNYFRLYDKLSGMTGTAFTEAEEFQQIYGLDVIQIPPNKPIVRTDHDDKIFKTEKGKIMALVEDVRQYHEKGRPVLIGSASIAKNEMISHALNKAGLKHEMLNAKNNEREAEIVALAGQEGAITLATNIAGRGTDIMLGEGIAEKGGLVVIGSERHEARRIDNQLRGRGGRQGDPGDTIFYVSTEDDLMRIFQGDRIAALMGRLGVAEDQAITNKAVSKTLEAAQKRVEGFNFDTRKNVVQYDNVINRHRKVVYQIRRKILEGDDLTPEIFRLIDARLKTLMASPIRRDKKLIEEFEEIFPIEKSEIEKIGKIKNDKKRLQSARARIEELYADKEDELTPELLRGVEREIYMQVLDILWMQHLENMQHLREGIHWRSVGQRDPLVEYRAESQKLFDSLQETLQNEVLRTVFHLRRDQINERKVEDDEYESELTRAAESAVEKGVNEAGLPESHNSDDDFKVKKGTTTADKNHAKKTAQKKKKAQRQNRKKGRH